MFVCTPASVWERGPATCATEGQGWGRQQGIGCGYWLEAELWRHLLGKSHTCRRTEADQKKNVWSTEMGCTKFLASKQDLRWASVFIAHFTFQTDVCFSNSLNKNQAVFVVYDLSEGWVFSSYCTEQSPEANKKMGVLANLYICYCLKQELYGLEEIGRILIFL